MSGGGIITVFQFIQPQSGAEVGTDIRLSNRLLGMLGPPAQSGHNNARQSGNDDDYNQYLNQREGG